MKLLHSITSSHQTGIKSVIIIKIYMCSCITIHIKIEYLWQPCYSGPHLAHRWPLVYGPSESSCLVYQLYTKEILFKIMFQRQTANVQRKISTNLTCIEITLAKSFPVAFKFLSNYGMHIRGNLQLCLGA